MEQENIDEAGIVKVGKQFAHHRIMSKKKKSMLQRIKDKLSGKKKYHSDEVYLNAEEAAAMSVGAGVIAGMPTASPPEQTPVRKKKKFKVLRRRLMGEGRVTTKPTGNGFHRVFVDGEEHPHVHIVNGSGGVSGYGRNVYGIHYSKPNKTRWIGSLAKTKAHLNKMLDDGAM